MPGTQLPDTMLAIEIIEPGPPGVLKTTQRPRPQPAAGEVLIRVAAAGVNRPDCLQRQGLYPPPPGASDLPGLEVAGHVAATGDGVDGWNIGDPVCALLNGGGYAAYAAAPAGQCLPIPDGWSPVEAASLPETFFTVWSNVFDRAGLRAGETLLVHGGAGGIGTTAIQLGRAFGARVFATAGSDVKCAFCESLGAERAINYREADFLSELKSDGADVILDIVGAPYLDRNLKLLRPDGRLVIVAVLGGTAGDINLARVMMKRIAVTGSTMRARDATFKAAIADQLHEHVWPLLANRTVRPVIQAVFDLADAPRAHELLDANDAMGKVVLTLPDAK